MRFRIKMSWLDLQHHLISEVCHLLEIHLPHLYSEVLLQDVSHSFVAEIK